MVPEDGLRGDLELRTIPRLIRIAADRFRDDVAISDGDTQLTYAELAAAAHRAARALIAAGVARGDRVAVWAPNRWEWIVAALGAHAAGAALVPINTRFKGSEAAYVLAR